MSDSQEWMAGDLGRNPTQGSTMLIGESIEMLACRKEAETKQIMHQAPLEEEEPNLEETPGLMITFFPLGGEKEDTVVQDGIPIEEGETRVDKPMMDPEGSGMSRKMRPEEEEMRTKMVAGAEESTLVRIFISIRILSQEVLSARSPMDSLNRLGELATNSWKVSFRKTPLKWSSRSRPVQGSRSFCVKHP